MRGVIPGEGEPGGVVGLEGVELVSAVGLEGVELVGAVKVEAWKGGNSVGRLITG